MSLLLAQDTNALVGRDTEPKVGDRVILTVSGRQWEVEKAQRTDNGGGGNFLREQNCDSGFCMRVHG